jgi:hypothetical protein
MRLRPGLAAFLVVLVAGCGGGGGQKASKPVTDRAQAAASVVSQLERATAKRDYATICDELLTASERSQAGGAECPRLMAARAQGVAHPRIVIRRIELTPKGALVHVQTTATGQAPTNDIIHLVLEGGRLRIAALGR